MEVKFRYHRSQALLLIFDASQKSLIGDLQKQNLKGTIKLKLELTMIGHSQISEFVKNFELEKDLRTFVNSMQDLYCSINNKAEVEEKLKCANNIEVSIPLEILSTQKVAQKLKTLQSLRVCREISRSDLKLRSIESTQF